MDNFEKLEQIKQMLDDGVLTPEEFEKSKKKILFPESTEKDIVDNVPEIKREDTSKQINNIVGNVKSKLQENNTNRKKLIIIAAGVLLLLIVVSVVRANIAEKEKATIAAYKESLSHGNYRYEEGGGYFVSISFWNDGDLYVITNDFVAGERNAFLSMDSAYDWYNGHTYWSVEKDSRGYYVSTGLDPYNKFYLPEDSSTTPQSLVDSEGHIFE